VQNQDEMIRKDSGFIFPCLLMVIATFPTSAVH